MQDDNSVTIDNNIYEIEKGIPIPPKLGYPRAPKYDELFSKMGVGDSVALEDSRAADRVGSAAKKYMKQHPEVEFAKRKLAVGYRLWRIK